MAVNYSEFIVSLIMFFFYKLNVSFLSQKFSEITHRLATSQATIITCKLERPQQTNKIFNIFLVSVLFRLFFL